MRFYHPINDPIPPDVIETTYEGLSEEEAGIIDRQMDNIENGLRQRKIEKSIEMNNGKPGPTASKLMFGKKSNMELMAMLGIWFVKIEQNDPEAWQQMLKASNASMYHNIGAELRAAINDMLARGNMPT